MSSPWALGIFVYLILVVGTFVPALRILLRGVALHPGGPGFESSEAFSPAARMVLVNHFKRIVGTLGFWKKHAELYKYLHYYSLGWTIPSSVLVPVLTQAIGPDPYARWLVTVMSAFTAVLLAFHRALKVDANYRAFRQGESEFYDLYRRMLDRPQTFGATEASQVNNYIDAVENLRKYIRNAEIDNFPTLEQVKNQLDHEKSE